MASKTVGWQPESAEAWYRATRTTWPQVFVSDPEEMSEPAMLGLSSTTFTTYLVTTRGVVSGEESGAGGEEHGNCVVEMEVVRTSVAVRGLAAKTSLSSLGGRRWGAR